MQRYKYKNVARRATTLEGEDGRRGRIIEKYLVTQTLSLTQKTCVHIVRYINFFIYNLNQQSEFTFYKLML
jgi:hypothetical protein